MLTSAVTQDLISSLKPHLDLFKGLNGKQVLITGGNGLIPGAMVATLAILNKEFGINVRGIATFHHNRSELDRLVSAGYKNIDILPIELSQPFSINEHADFIIHGASLASPRKYLAHRMDTIKVNVQASMSLLEKAYKDKAENFLYISSGEIYGSPPRDQVPTKEEYYPAVDHLNDRGCYVESKRFSESICYQFSQETGQKVSVVRPIHVFGPGLTLNDGRVVAEFLAHASQEKKVVVNSDGTDRRSFCYLTDANLMLWHVLLAQKEKFDVYNVGNPSNDVSIAELAEVVASITGATVDILGEKPVFAAGTPARSSPDISKLKDHFGIAPQYALSQGLQQTLNWMRESNAF